METVLENRDGCLGDFCSYQAVQIPQMNMIFFGMSLLFYANDYCAFVRSVLFHEGRPSADGLVFDVDAFSQCWRRIAPVSMRYSLFILSIVGFWRRRLDHPTSSPGEL